MYPESAFADSRAGIARHWDASARGEVAARSPPESLSCSSGEGQAFRTRRSRAPGSQGEGSMPRQQPEATALTHSRTSAPLSCELHHRHPRPALEQLTRTRGADAAVGLEQV